MVAKAGLVPLDETYADLAARGLPCGDDKFHRLTKAGLLRKSKRIPGSKKHGIQPDQVLRLGRILEVDRLLGGAADHPRLAFWLACKGLDLVPPDLVARHISDAVRAVLSLGRLSVERMGTGRVLRKRRQITREAAIAALVVRAVFRDYRFPRTARIEGQREVLEKGLEIIIAVLFNNSDIRSYEPDVRRIVGALIPDKDAAEAVFARLFPILIEEAPALRAQFGSNTLLRDIEIAKREQPLKIIRAVRLTQHLLTQFIQSMNKLDPNTQQPPHKPTTNEVITSKMASNMPGFVAAVFLQDMMNGEAEKLFRRLEGGEDIGLHEFFKRWFRISNIVQRRYLPHAGS